MFDLLIDIVLERILKERAKEATPKTGPIDFQDFVGLPGVSPLLNWLAGSVEARRLDPSATITPPPFWTEAQATAGVTNIPLLCGMEFTAVVPLMTEFVTAAQEAARFRLNHALADDADSLVAMAKVYRRLVGDEWNALPAMAIKSAAAYAKLIAAEAFSIMFKLHAMDVDAEGFDAWVDRMTTVSSPWAHGDDPIGDDEPEDFPCDDTEPAFYPRRFWNALDSTLNAANMPVPPRFCHTQPEAYFIPEFLPQHVAPHSWRVGDSYHSSYSGALLSALAWMIAERPNQLRNHLEDLAAKGSTTFVPDPQP